MLSELRAGGTGLLHRAAEPDAVSLLQLHPLVWKEIARVPFPLFAISAELHKEMCAAPVPTQAHFLSESGCFHLGRGSAQHPRRAAFPHWKTRDSF